MPLNTGSHDFFLADHGSIVILTPTSDEGRAWLDENIPDDAQWWANGVVIEPRYLDPILDGIINDGLTF